MVEELSPGEVRERLDDGLQVVDIRSAAQFEQGHIPGAINIPMTELPARVDEVEWGEEIVVACPIGQSSVQAARLIDSFEGIAEDDDVRSMAGGYEKWDYELEAGDEAE